MTQPLIEPIKVYEEPLFTSSCYAIPPLSLSFQVLDISNLASKPSDF